AGAQALMEIRNGMWRLDRIRQRRSSKKSNQGGEGQGAHGTSKNGAVGCPFQYADRRTPLFFGRCRARKYPTRKMRGERKWGVLYSLHDNTETIFLGSRRSPRRQVRRQIPDRRADNRHLLPAIVHRAPTQSRERSNRPHGRRGEGFGPARLQALPPGPVLSRRRRR